jgi:hypothetical protein
MQALETEIDLFLKQNENILGDEGRRQIVRRGYGP